MGCFPPQVNNPPVAEDFSPQALSAESVGLAQARTSGYPYISSHIHTDIRIQNISAIMIALVKYTVEQS